MLLKFLSKNFKCIAQNISAVSHPRLYNTRVHCSWLTLDRSSVMPPKRGRPAKAASMNPSKEAKSSSVASMTRAKRTKREDDDEEPITKKSKIEAPKPMMNKVDTDLSSVNFGCDKLNFNGHPYNLKITSWNVSGIRAVIKKNGIDYLLKEGADIIALQETKCESSKLPPEVKLPGYQRFFLESKKSGYCGVALYSKVKPIDVKYGLSNSYCNDEGRCIMAEFEKFYLINVYVPNAGPKLVTMPKRLKWNTAFKAYVKKLDENKPVIICGDMNVAHQEIDLKNPKTNTKNAGFTQEERDGMTDLLESGFVDTFRDLYPDRTDAYTFWAYFAQARAKNIGWRLDYYLVSERIKKNVCDQVIRKEIYGSDHCPVVLYANL